MESGARIKHILLLSDGASIRPAREHEGLIDALARSGITVTSIRIGDDKDSFALVQEISRRTNGGFHHGTDAVSLPSLMIEDARQRAGRRDEPEEEEAEPAPELPFRPRVVRAAEALGGLTTAEMPTLEVFAEVPVKPGAEVWLDAERGGKRSPILAAWQNGLGRVAVFTANPTHEWQSWGQVRRFWSQLLRWLARPQSADELRLALRREAGEAILSIDTFDGGADELVLRVTGLDGTERELRPTALGPRHHEVALPPLDAIEPRIEILPLRDGKELQRHEEWLPPPTSLDPIGVEDPEADPDQSLLQQIAEITGGSVDPERHTILRRAPAERQIVSPLGAWFLMSALGLVLFDLGLRLFRTTLLG